MLRQLMARNRILGDNQMVLSHHVVGGLGTHHFPQIRDGERTVGRGEALIQHILRNRLDYWRRHILDGVGEDPHELAVHAVLIGVSIGAGVHAGVVRGRDLRAGGRGLQRVAAHVFHHRQLAGRRLHRIRQLLHRRCGRGGNAALRYILARSRGALNMIRKRPLLRSVGAIGVGIDIRHVAFARNTLRCGGQDRSFRNLATTTIRGYRQRNRAARNTGGKSLRSTLHRVFRENIREGNVLEYADLDGSCLRGGTSRRVRIVDRVSVVSLALAGRNSHLERGRGAFRTRMDVVVTGVRNTIEHKLCGVCPVGG